MHILTHNHGVGKLYGSVAQRFLGLGLCLLELFFLLEQGLYPGGKLPTLELSCLQGIVELTQPAVYLSYLDLKKLKPLLE
ncbi:MAG: hypothetical protein ACPL7L_03140 [bacterium]